MLYVYVKNKEDGAMILYKYFINVNYLVDSFAQLLTEGKFYFLISE